MTAEKNTKFEPIIVVQTKKYFINIYRFKIDILEAKYNHELNRNEASIYPFASLSFKYITDIKVKKFYDKFCIEDDFIYNDIYYTFNDIVQIINDSKKEYSESIKEYIEPEIIIEANKIISGKNVMKYLLDFFSIKYVGDEQFKKYSIYTLMSLGIENIDETLHTFSYGSTEIGKTEMSSRMLEVLPSKFKLPYDDISPKTLWYMKNKIHPNMLMCMNDKNISDDFAELLLKDCDKNGWNNGCTRGIPNSDKDGVMDMHIPPRILWWITSNKPIIDHAKKDSISDYNSLSTRFYCYHRKDYTKEEIKKIKEHIAKFVIPIDYEHKRDIVSQIIRNLIEEPKFIDLNTIFLYPKIEELCSKSGLRQTQRIYTLLKCSALMRGSNIVEDEDIINITQLLIDVETTEAELDRETPLILKHLLPEDIFMSIWNSTNNINKDKKKFVETYDSSGISKSTGININSLRPKLKKLREMNIIGSRHVFGTSKTWLSFKLKDNTETIMSDYVSNEIAALKIQKDDHNLLPQGNVLKPTERLFKEK